QFVNSARTLGKLLEIRKLQKPLSLFPLLVAQEEQSVLKVNLPLLARSVFLMMQTKSVVPVRPHLDWQFDPAVSEFLLKASPSLGQWPPFDFHSTQRPLPASDKPEFGHPSSHRFVR